MGVSPAVLAAPMIAASINMRNSGASEEILIKMGHDIRIAMLVLLLIIISILLGIFIKVLIEGYLESKEYERNYNGQSDTFLSKK